MKHKGLSGAKRNRASVKNCGVKLMYKPQEELLGEGYREMAEENLAWAKMVFPLASEILFGRESRDSEDIRYTEVDAYR